jgi:hypothetical protein
VTINLFKDKGTPLGQQKFNWRELVQAPYSKLDEDAFTRVRVTLMNGIESEAVRFQHSCARMNQQLQIALAEVRRVEHHQQTMVNWLHPSDQTQLETTIGYEQTAIEITAAIAQQEPNAYLAQAHRFGLLEDFDHLYRYSALMDRVEGKDANNIIQSYTDIVPGRPTALEHRHPVDDVRLPYDRSNAATVTKLNSLTLVSAEHQVHDYYMNIGPTYPDPLGRQLYAEIASIEEQHVTQYESLIDPRESWLEKWVLHEATEVYNYWSCVESEENPRIKAIWERFLDYELGQLQFVAQLFQQYERRDIAEILDERLPAPLPYKSQRSFVREVLRTEKNFGAIGSEIMAGTDVPTSPASQAYRSHINSTGSPSEKVAHGYVWMPGTELSRSATKAA